jgi:hypothetical protein
MVLVRSVGVVKDHHRLFLRATGPATRAGRCERDTRRRRDVEYRVYHRGGSIGWMPARQFSRAWSLPSVKLLPIMTNIAPEKAAATTARLGSSHGLRR